MPAYARPVIQPTAMTKHSQHNIEETKRTILLFGEVLVDCFQIMRYRVVHHSMWHIICKDWGMIWD